MRGVDAAGGGTARGLGPGIARRQQYGSGKCQSEDEVNSCQVGSRSKE